MIEVRSRIGGERRCPLCQEGLEGARPQDVYTCQSCHTSFHVACTRELGGCTTLGCARQGRGQSIVGRESAPTPVQGEGALANLAGLAETLPDGRIKLEFDSLMESLWFGMGVFSVIGSLAGAGILFKHGEPAILIGSLIVLAVAVVLHMNTDDYFVVDADAFTLLFRRKFFSRQSLSRVATFDQIQAVTMNGRKQSTKSRTWWEYSVVLVLAGAKKVRVSDWGEHDYAKHHHLMEALGALVGARVHPAPLEHTLKVSRNKYTDEVEVRHVPPSKRLLYIVLAVICIGVALPLLVLMVKLLGGF
jgi:hypothetical protein